MDKSIGGTKIHFERMKRIVLIVGHPAAGFLYQQNTGCGVPRPEVIFKITVKSAAGNVRQIQKPGTRSADVGCSGNHIGDVATVILPFVAVIGETSG